jgi:uncharacterized protein affecting Mg2+/Co2+ transport
MKHTITIRDLLDGYRALSLTPDCEEFLCHYIRGDLKRKSSDDDREVLAFRFDIKECGDAIRDLFSQYFVLSDDGSHYRTIYGWFVESDEDESGNRYEYVNLTAGGRIRLPRDSSQQRIEMMVYILYQTPDATLTF